LAAARLLGGADHRCLWSASMCKPLYERTQATENDRLRHE